MSVLCDHGTPTGVTTSAEVAEGRSQAKRTATFQCLVLSADQQRRQLLSQSATDAGWDAVVCADTDSCWNNLRQEMFQLVLQDMEVSSKRRDQFRELAEHLSSQRGVLLVLCGNQGDAPEEIWARGIGAWLYLPGVERGCDIASLCQEAKHIAERLATGGPKLKT